MDYGKAINELVSKLEAQLSEVEKMKKEMKAQELNLAEREDKVEAMLNDAMAKLRIGEKYENFERLRAQVIRESVENKKRAAAIEEASKASEKISAGAKKDLAKVSDERRIVSSKISALKSKEAKIDTFLKMIKEEKLKGEFIKNIEREMRG